MSRIIVYSNLIGIHWLHSRLALALYKKQITPKMFLKNKVLRAYIVFKKIRENLINVHIDCLIYSISGEMIGTGPQTLDRHCNLNVNGIILVEQSFKMIFEMESFLYKCLVTFQPSGKCLAF